MDWKTGKAPRNEEELAAKSLQLAAYRLAWAQWTGTALADIGASFWFAQSSRLVTPSHLPDAMEFETLLVEALGE